MKKITRILSVLTIMILATTFLFSGCVYDTSDKCPYTVKYTDGYGLTLKLSGTQKKYLQENNSKIII